MEDNKHHIRTLSFDINYDRESDAFSFQKELSDFIKEEWLNVAEEVLTNVSEQKTIRIQKLKLDLGNILKENYKEESKSRLREYLSDKLRLMLHHFQPDDEGLSPEILSLEKTQWEELVYFLQTGSFPWNSNLPNEQIAINTIFSSVYQDNPSGLKKFIEENFRTEIILRIIRQVNEENRWKLVQLWFEREEITFLKLFYGDLIRIYQHKKILFSNLVDFKEQFWQFLLENTILKKLSSLTKEAVFEKYISFLSEKTGEEGSYIFRLFQHAIFPGSESTPSDEETKEYVPLKGIRTEFSDFIWRQKDKTDFVSENQNDIRNTSSNKSSVAYAKQQERILKENSPGSLKDENLKSKKTAVILFFRLLAHSGYSPAKVYVRQISSWIKELSETEPSFLQEELREIGKNQNDYQVMRMLETFEPDVSEHIWNSIDGQRDYKEFRKEKYFELFRSILEYGAHFTAYSNQIALHKKVLQPIISHTFQYYEQVEWLYEQIRKNKPFKKENWLYIRSLLSVQDKKKYAKVIDKIEELWQKNETRGRKEKVIKQLIEPDQLPITEKFSCISFLISEKKLPEYYNFSVSELLQSLIREDPTKLIQFINLLSPKDKKHLWKFLPKQLKEQIGESEKESEKTERQFSEAISEVSISEEKIQKIKETANDTSRDPEYTFKKISEGEPVYIDNSGLILFHPYLPRFFKLLDLLDGRQFKDEHAAHKAAHLLQYLVNKMEQSEEHHMFLNKLLCGIDPEIPLIREIELSEKEKTLGEELISGVIQNWPILKKTSNDNFRASFLMRKGRLIAESQGWRLRVEEKGYDILVEKIPWSISMIMLPWMKKIIYVEWK